MIGLDSAEAFLASPIGHCLVRDGYVVWCTSPSLAGVILWGTLNRSFIEDVVDLGARLQLAAPWVICDFRELETIHLEDVVALVEGARPPGPRIGGLTVVLPAGLSGIIVAGATVALSSEFRPVLTSDIASALSPLGADAANRYVAVEEIAMKARGTSFFVARLRNHIAADLTGATIESSAAALCTSERTLQRRLRDAGTSFGEQLRRARVAAAWQLVRFSDLKIDAIAARVGFGNSSRMGAVFRAELGMTPAELRVPAAVTTT